MIFEGGGRRIVADRRGTTACALPDASWEPEFRRYLETLAPGQNIWQAGREHLIAMLEWQL